MVARWPFDRLRRRPRRRRGRAVEAYARGCSVPRWKFRPMPGRFSRRTAARVPARDSGLYVRSAERRQPHGDEPRRHRTPVRAKALDSASEAVAPAASRSDDQPGRTTRPLSAGDPPQARSCGQDGPPARWADSRSPRHSRYASSWRMSTRPATSEQPGVGCRGSSRSARHRSQRSRSPRRRWPSSVTASGTSGPGDTETPASSCVTEKPMSTTTASGNR